MNLRNQTRACLLACLILLCLPAWTSVRAQQPNSPGASMVVAGVDGPAWPIEININSAIWGANLELQVNGGASRDFVIYTAGGLSTAGLPTNFGLVDLDLSSNLTQVLSGTTSLGGNTSFVFALPNALDISTQAVVVDPTSSFGLRLSAATRLTTFSAPPTMAAVYVSASRGVSSSTPGVGSAGQPFSDFSAALAEAQTSAVSSVLVEAGIYSEPNGFEFPDGIDVTGGLNAISWLPIPGAVSGINVGQGSAVARNVVQGMTIRNLNLQAADRDPGIADGSASVALYVISESSPGLLNFLDCMFLAGDGADGAQPLAPSPAAPGGSGGNGSTSNGGSPGTGTGNGLNGGAGGKGGNDSPSTPDPAPGEFGQGTGGGGFNPRVGTNACPGWGSGGREDGVAGADQGPGLPGRPGSGASVPGVADEVGGFFSISAQRWQSGVGRKGVRGLGGRGGGGGGGGSEGFFGGDGGGGGGGGGGGEGGEGGSGGQNGGASIAVFLYDANPGFTSCVFESLRAGNGAPGAAGGEGGGGGAGGLGGPENADGTAGEAGAAGGKGGPGSGGGGGSGGPSWCVANSGTSNHVAGASNIYSAGVGGTFANGGDSGPPVTASFTPAPSENPCPAGGTTVNSVFGTSGISGPQALIASVPIQ